MPYTAHHFRSTGLVIIGIMILLLTGAAGAAVFEHGDEVHITNLHRIEGDLYASGNTVTVDGYIGGDFCCFSNTVNSNGEVAASENICAYNYRQGGRVDGSLRAFAYQAEIEGYIGRSLLLVGFETRVGSRAVIRRDLVASGYKFDFAGRLMGNLKAEAENVHITGTIDGDVKVEAKRLVIAPPAVIKGNLTYTCEHQMEIDTAGGVVVLGDIVWQLPGKEEKLEEESSPTAGLKNSLIEISRILASFLLGLIIIFLFGRYAEETTKQLRTRPTIAVAVGLLTVLVGILSLLALFTSLMLLIIGLVMLSGEMAVIGAMLLVVSILMLPISTFAGLFSGALCYLGTIAFAPVLGCLLMRLARKEPSPIGKLPLLLGLVVIALLSWIPYIGTAIYLIFSVLGAGGIVLGIRHCRQTVNLPTNEPLSNQTDNNSSPE